MPVECARSTCSNNSLKRDTFADYHTFPGKKSRNKKALLSSEEILVLIWILLVLLRTFFAEDCVRNLWAK